MTVAEPTPVKIFREIPGDGTSKNMFYFGFKFVKFFIELPTFDRKICFLSVKIIPFYYPKTKFKHTLTKQNTGRTFTYHLHSATTTTVSNKWTLKASTATAI